MKISISECRGLSEPQIILAAALIQNACDKDQLVKWATSIWPDLEVYSGNSHWRFHLNGDMCSDMSFYVDVYDYNPHAGTISNFVPEKGGEAIFAQVAAKLSQNMSERRMACALALPALQRLADVMKNKTGQGFRLRALLYSLYNGQATSLLEVVGLDWAIRIDLGRVILAFGFEDQKSSTNFFYKDVKTAIQQAGLWSWFIEEDNDWKTYE